MYRMHDGEARTRRRRMVGWRERERWLSHHTDPDPSKEKGGGQGFADRPSSGRRSRAVREEERKKGPKVTTSKRQGRVKERRHAYPPGGYLHILDLDGDAIREKAKQLSKSIKKRNPPSKKGTHTNESLHDYHVSLLGPKIRHYGGMWTAHITRLIALMPCLNPSSLTPST